QLLSTAIGGAAQRAYADGDIIYCRVLDLFGIDIEPGYRDTWHSDRAGLCHHQLVGFDPGAHHVAVDVGTLYRGWIRIDVDGIHGGQLQRGQGSAVESGGFDPDHTADGVADAHVAEVIVPALGDGEVVGRQPDGIGGIVGRLLQHLDFISL